MGQTDRVRKSWLGSVSVKKCNVSTCQRKHWAKGYCSAHYYRRQRHGDVFENEPIRGTAELCFVSGCRRKVHAYGLCHPHRQRQIRRGNIQEEIPIGSLPTMGYSRHATPKARRRPMIKDLTWAAGFLDADGSVGRYGKVARISGFQNDPELLYRLQEIFGGKVGYRKPSENRFSKNGQYTWAASGMRARGIIMTLYAIFSKRRKQQSRAALA